MRLVYPLLICLVPVFYACNDTKPTEPVIPVIDQDAERVKSELANRSFRSFHPARDAQERKGVILDFSDSDDHAVGLWAQYALTGTALSEWEVSARDYSVEKSGSEYRLVPIEPSSFRYLPMPCENCIPVTGLSISVRNLFNGGDIQFKLNNTGNQLPSPFPVFDAWSTWSEDESFDE